VIEVSAKVLELGGRISECRNVHEIVMRRYSPDGTVDTEYVFSSMLIESVALERSELREAPPDVSGAA